MAMRADARRNRDRLLVAVNYGPTQGQCYVRLPFADLRGRTVVLRDLLSPAVYERTGDEPDRGAAETCRATQHLPGGTLSIQAALRRSHEPRCRPTRW